MSDFDNLDKHANERIRLAAEYAKARKKYGEDKSDMDIHLTAYILEMQDKVKNIGYERAMLTLIAMKPELKELYKSMIEQLNNYKAIERMIEAQESKITSIQSRMRYLRENDGGGY